MTACACVHSSAVLLEMPGSLQDSSLGLVVHCVWEIENSAAISRI